MLGALLTGLSFGIFFSIIVPLVNEMYGQLEFGMIWGVQVSSQAQCLMPPLYMELIPQLYIAISEQS